MQILNRLLDSVGVEDIIALFFTGVVGFLWLTGQDVPEGLLNVTLIIIGFFFGDKNAARAQTRALQVMSPPIAPPYIEGAEEE
jgi:hypothetical protein